MSRYPVPEPRRSPSDPPPRPSLWVTAVPRSNSMSSPASSKLPEPKKRLAQKDEAIRRKLESELSRKRNISSSFVPAPTAIVRRKSAATKGTLAALRPSPALTVTETTSVAEASRLCAAKRTNCILVVDEEEGLSGIVTAKDIAYRVIADGLDPRTTILRQIMTRDPTVALETSNVTDALELMVSNKFRHLPVCGEDESVTGVVDLMKVFHETLDSAQRRSTASEQLLNAMAGVKAELGSEGANSEMLAWVAKLREKTALPDLSSIIGSHTQPATASPKTSVRVVAQIMKEQEVSAVCIMEEAPQSPGTVRRPSRVVGMLTSEDIVLRVIAAGLDALHCSVVRVMAPRPETVRPTMSIHIAAKLMHDTQRFNIPIVEDDDRLVAVINILTLAQASHEQIKAANQEVTLPEAPLESRPMIGRFLDSIRSDTPASEPLALPTSPAVTDDALLSPQSEVSTSDSMTMVDEMSAMSLSITSLGDLPISKEVSTSSAPITMPVEKHENKFFYDLSSPPTVASVLNSVLDSQSPPELFKDLPNPSAVLSPPAVFSPLISPISDAGTYTFKFRAPNGITHRFQARTDDCKGLREMVIGKLSSDSLFNTTTSGPRPDPNDFHMLYKDEDGDDVAIADDDNVRHAVAASRKEGTDRVMLTVQGGSSWQTAAGATDGENKAVAVAEPPIKEDILEPSVATVVPAPPPEPPRSEFAHVHEAPPEYTPKPTPDDISSQLHHPQATAPTQIPAFTVHSYTEPVDVKQGPLDKLFSRPPLDDREDTKTPSRPSPVSFPTDEKRKPATNAGSGSAPRGAQSEEREALNKIRDLVTRLAVIFNDVDLYKELLECRDTEAQKLLDTFQTLLDTPGLSSKFKRNLIVATQRLSRRAGLYPTCYNLEDIEMIEDNPIAAGSFADIYKALFLGQAVCLKVIRVYQTSHVQSFLKQFSAEAILWGQLSHLNLLPVYGLYRFSGRLCLVSPWMENGDIIRFLMEHPGVNRALLVLDISSGIAYLHDKDVVHGDLKGANILVDGCGRARLADFGLSAVTDSEILHWTANSSAGSRGGSIRWQAPELFDIENDDVVHNTKASDVYAFACVAYEIFTGNIPFFEQGRDHAVMLKVRSGETPSRPEPSSRAWSVWGLTEATWSLLESCWRSEPSQRPNIQGIVSYFQSTIHVDGRPLESDDLVLTPAHFRDSVGGRAELPSVFELDAMLSKSDENEKTMALPTPVSPPSAGQTTLPKARELI